MVSPPVNVPPDNSFQIISFRFAQNTMHLAISSHLTLFHAFTARLKLITMSCCFREAVPHPILHAQYYSLDLFSILFAYIAPPQGGG